MGRGHTPYGYRIEDGTAVIIPEEAEKIRRVYVEYLSGRSYADAGKNAGLHIPHGSVKRLLQNVHYLGDEFYPAVIDKEIFDAAETERLKRARRLGRMNLQGTGKREHSAETRFSMRPPERTVKDPYERAAYIYSLIESEE